MKHHKTNRSSHQNSKKVQAFLRERRLLVFVVLFGLFGGALILMTQAATPTASFEPEAGTLTNNAKLVSDATASGGQAIQFQAPSLGFPVHPGVVYSQSDIDAWSSTSPEYTALSATTAGRSYNIAGTPAKYVPIYYGTRIDSGGVSTCTGCELNDGLKDQSGVAKIQAMLWEADDNIERKNRVIAYLDGFRDVTSYEWDNDEQYRLVSGWGCTNLAQAAEIVDYQGAGFKNFLRLCYDKMDWPTNPNWHASFADSKLAIAAYLGDATLWADAKAYFYERIAQSIYHASYDNGFVKPMHSEDNVTNGGTSNSAVPARLHASPGTTHVSRTVSQWGRGLITSSLVAEYPAGTPFQNGTNAEILRDLGHVNMGIGAFMHGARTILAQGEQLQQHAYDRLLAGYSYHSGRVYTHTTTGSYPAPVPQSGDGGTSRFAGYYGARKLFGAATPTSVNNMIGRTEVNTTYAYAIQNHFVAERFADGL